MYSLRKKILFLSLLICLSFVFGSRGENNGDYCQITGIYSDVEFFPESGDVAGIEIIIVSTNKGYYVIFQSAEGEFRVPFVVECNVIENKVEFTLPNNQGYSGKFQGEISQTALSGSFEKGQTDYRGNKLIVLKRGNSFWQ